MGKGVRDATKQAASETTEVAMKKTEEPPAQQFSNATLGNDFSFVEKNKGNLEILFGLWMKQKNTKQVNLNYKAFIMVQYGVETTEV